MTWRPELLAILDRVNAADRISLAEFREHHLYHLYQASQGSHLPSFPENGGACSWSVTRRPPFQTSQASLPFLSPETGDARSSHISRVASNFPSSQAGRTSPLETGGARLGHAHRPPTCRHCPNHIAVWDGGCRICNEEDL